MTIEANAPPARRPAGAGNVIETVDGHGRLRFKARAPKRNGRRPSLGTFDTRDDAERRLDAFALETAAAGKCPVGGTTLRDYGLGWLKARELGGQHRDVEGVTLIFDNHIATSDFADAPIADVTRRDVKAWLAALRRRRIRYPHAHPKNGKPLEAETVKRIFSVLHSMLDEAVDDEIIEANPAHSSARKKRSRAGRVDEPWTYLLPEEQAAIATSDKMPEPLRLVILVALYTGLRASELAALRLPDVKDLDGADPHLLVKRSRRDGPTKRGRPHRVPLIDRARRALKRWLEILPSYLEPTKDAEGPNPKRYVFPTPNGCRRQSGKMLGCDYLPLAKKGDRRRKVDRFARFMTELGLIADARHDGRHVRWHDLRHSWASSLVSGWWGRAWSLEEIRDFGGWSTIKMVERYAHLGETALKAAVRATVDAAPARPPTPPEPAPTPRVDGPIDGPADSAPARETLQNPESHLRDLNSRPTVYERPGFPGALVPLGAHGTTRRTIELAELGRGFLEAVAAGRDVDPAALADAVDRGLADAEAELAALRAAVNAAASAPPAFAHRRAIELAARLAEMTVLPVGTGENAQPYRQLAPRRA